MQKHVLWAALISACVFVSATSLSACTEVLSCTENEAGCKGGKPVDGKCKFNLMPDGDKCVEPGTGGNGGDKDGGDDAAITSVCGVCDAPALCLPETKTCVNFCETPDPVPGSGETFDLVVCGGDIKNAQTMEKWIFDLKASCNNTCLLTCRWQNWFCDATIDCKAECAKDYVQDDCTTGCGAKPDDAARVACQDAKCVDVRKRTCVEDSSLCPGGMVTPACAEFSCTNECGSGTADDDNAVDGYCDDGAYISSGTDFCPFGTDCSDCGPREGKAQPVDTQSLGFGDACPNSWRCPGHSSNHDLNKSWCLEVNAGVGRCLVDCSSDNETCEGDYECVGLTSDGKPLKDKAGRQGRACAPKIDGLCN